MRLLPLLLTALTLTLLSQVSLAEDYYKWVDENGSTHYTDRPKADQQGVKVSTHTGHSEPTQYTAPASQKKSTEKDENKIAEQATKQVPIKDPERCARAKEQVETLTTHARVRTKGDDGEIRFLTPTEHQKKMEEGKQAVKESC